MKNLWTQTFLCVALSGCVSLLPEAGEEPNTYTLPLQEVNVPTLRHKSSTYVLKIAKVDAEQSLRTSRILVRKKKEDGTVQSQPLANALWSENLPSLVEHRLIQTLRHSHLFKSVISIDEVAEADFLLIPSIERFELYEKSNHTLQAVVVFHITLTHSKTRQTQSSSTFTKEVPLKDKTQGASLSALTLAFQDVMNQVSQWMRRIQE